MVCNFYFLFVKQCLTLCWVAERHTRSQSDCHCFFVFFYCIAKLRKHHLGLRKVTKAACATFKFCVNSLEPFSAPNIVLITASDFTWHKQVPHCNFHLRVSMWVCVCVCEYVRERDRQRGRDREKEGNRGREKERDEKDRQTDRLQTECFSFS